jgi:transposase
MQSSSPERNTDRNAACGISTRPTVRMRIDGMRRPAPRRAAWRIPRDLRPALVPILRTIADLTARIGEFERRIEQLATERHPETTRLRQVNGVGAITALTFVLTLEDPGRFRSTLHWP